MTDERRSWIQAGGAFGLVALVAALLGMPASSDGSRPAAAVGSMFDQQILPVGITVSGCFEGWGSACPVGPPGPPDPPMTTPRPPATAASARTVTTAGAAAASGRPAAPAAVPAAAAAAVVVDPPRGHATEFLLTGYRWDACRTIKVATDGPPVQPIVAELAAMTGLDLQVVTGPADIAVRWGTIGVRGAIGLTELATQGATIVHATVTILRGGAIVMTVLRHEMGHALGLGHVDQPGEIMYPSARIGSPFDYQAGDVAGLRSVGAPATGC